MLILLYLHTTVDPLSRLHVLEMVVRWCVYIILVPPRQLFNSSPNFQISSTAFNKINRSVSVSELTNQTAVSSRSISIAIDFALRFIVIVKFVTHPWLSASGIYSPSVCHL